MNNISFWRGTRKKTYGTIEDDFTEWLFSADRPFLGVYGRQSMRGIEELGVITLDTGCQATVPSPIDQGSTRDDEDVHNGSYSGKTTRDVIPFGLDPWTCIAIGLVVVFIITVIAGIISSCINTKKEHMITAVETHAKPDSVNIPTSG